MASDPGYVDALARGDVPWILRAVTAEHPGLATLELLLARPEPEVIHAALLRVQTAMERPGSSEDLAGVIALMPLDLTGRPPETQALMAAIARLVGSPSSLPDWRAHALPPAVEAAWLCTEAALEPERVARWPLTTMALDALWRVPIVSMRDPATLLRVLCAQGDPGLERVALAHMDTCLRAARLGPAAIAPALRALVRSPNRGARLQAARRLAEPWAAALESPRRDLVALLDDGGATAFAALDALAAHGHTAELRAVLRDPGRPPALRRAAMAPLGEKGCDDDVPALLDAASEDPLYFAATCIRAVQALYRRGVRPAAGAEASLVALYLGDYSTPPLAVAELLTSRWREYISSLEGLSPADVHFARHVALLREAESPDAASKLRAWLGAASTREHWPELIDALAAVDGEAAEADVLARFDAEPLAAIAALRAIGGEATARFLRAQQSMDFSVDGPDERSRACGAPRSLPPWKGPALDLLARISDQQRELTALLALRPVTPAIMAALRPGESRDVLAAIEAIALQNQHPLRGDAIASLGHASSLAALAPLRALLLDPLPEIAEAARDAIRTLGADLYSRRSGGTAALRRATTTPEAQDYLLAEALLAELDAPWRSDAQLLRLLEPLVGRRHPQLTRRVRRLLRHKNPRVVRLALACVGASGDARAAAWAVPFLRSNDIYTLRQALVALGSLCVPWAAADISASLEHSNMNLRKAAAAALATSGSPAAVPALLRQLRTHDNPGLCELVIAALRAILRDGYAATLQSALISAATPGERTLVTRGLDGVLAPVAIAAIAHALDPDANELLAGFYSGRLRLASGTLADLDAQLTRAGLGHRIPRTDPEPQAARAMRAHRLRSDRARLDALLRGSLQRDSAGAAELEALLSQLGRSELGDEHVAVLREHLASLLAMLAGARTALTAHVAALLAHLAPRLSLAERFALIIACRRATSTQRLADAAAMPLLHAAGAVLTTDEARRAAATDRADVARWAARFLLLDEGAAPTGLPALRSEAHDDERRRRALERALHAGQYDAAFEWASDGGPEAVALLRERWEQLFGDDKVLEKLVSTLSSLQGAQRRPWVRWLIATQAHETRHALWAMAREPGAEQALILEALARDLSSHEISAWRSLLEDTHATTRARAAHALTTRREPEIRAALLAFLVAASPAISPTPSLDRHELRAVSATLLARSTDAALEQLAILAAHARVHERVPVLFEVWCRSRDRAATVARDALRVADASEVLPHVLPALWEARFGALEVLGRSSWTDPALVALLSSAPPSGREALIRHLATGALALTGASGLAGPGLPEALMTAANLTDDPRLAYTALGALAAWGHPETAARLADFLRGEIARGVASHDALAALLRGSAQQPPEWRIMALAPIQRADVADAVLDRIAEMYVADPSIAHALTEPMPTRLRERAVRLIDHADPAVARRALTIVAAERTPEARARVAAAVEHRQPRVRALAHRLLKSIAPPEVYLAATVALLADRVPSVRIRAVRILSFARHAPAVRAMVPLLYDPQTAVQRATRHGLARMGRDHVGILRAELARTRPDRRAALHAVITQLEAEG